MSGENFKHMLEAKWDEGKFVCVGLDSEFGRIPAVCRVSEGVLPSWVVSIEETLFNFNRAIVDATSTLVCAYKANLAFYLENGPEGLRALQRTVEYIHKTASGVVVILDAKFADIGNTNRGYVAMAFDWLNADAVTVNPYLGGEALGPFLARADKGIIVLCKTSNMGSYDVQNQHVKQHSDHDAPVSLYKHIARRVAQTWNKNDNCALVVGATYPDELREVRQIALDLPILIPGIGKQGGDVERTVTAGKDSLGWGMIINSSRDIIFASPGEDFAEAAHRETTKLHNLISRYR